MDLAFTNSMLEVTSSMLFFLLQVPVTQTILKQLYKVYVPVTHNFKASYCATMAHALSVFRLLLLKLYFFD